MKSCQEKYNAFKSTFQIAVYFTTECLALLKMCAVSWFVLILETYVTGIHNDRIILVTHLKFPRFLQNIECKNERI